MSLEDQVRAACRTMNFASSTEQCYWRWIVDYLQFHKQRNGLWIHPDQLRESEAEMFLADLAVRRRLASSSQTQALCALVFLYESVLKQPLGQLAAIRAGQELLGHVNVETTMIYTHVLKAGACGVVSPLDRLAV